MNKIGESGPSSKRELMRRVLIISVVISAVVAIYVAGKYFLSLDALAEQEAALRSLLRNYPLRSFVACFACYLVISFVPGTTGKSMVVAWLFGFWQGLLIVNIALTVAATGSLLVGRYLFRDIVSRRWHAFVAAANQALQRDGGFYVLLLRLLHAPFTVVNYSLGATSIKARTFWWATQIGLLPGNIIFVYAGTQLPSIRQLTEDGVWSLFDPQLIIAFVLLTISPLAVRWLAMRIWPRVEHDVEIGEQQL